LFQELNLPHDMAYPSIPKEMLNGIISVGLHKLVGNEVYIASDAEPALKGFFGTAGPGNVRE